MLAHKYGKFQTQSAVGEMFNSKYIRTTIETVNAVQSLDQFIFAIYVSFLTENVGGSYLKLSICNSVFVELLIQFVFRSHIVV